MQRLDHLIAVILLIGSLLALGRTFPTLVTALVGFSLVALLFAALPFYLARTIVARGDPLEDRVAAFLCIALFTLPIQFIFLLYLAVALGSD
jgi:hypothetical protein